MTSAVEAIVSVDQVAYLRAGRGGGEPDPVHFALQAELAGVDGIRAHLRFDQRYITEDDAVDLNRLCKTTFYLQVSPHQDVLHLVNTIRPHNLILAAERREEQAVDSGLDAMLLANELKGIIPNVDQFQTRVFLFLEPELDQIKMAARLGVHGVLINVRDLMVDNRNADAKKWQRISDAVRLAAKFNLEPHLGGGIIAKHLSRLAAIPGVRAIHFGHQLVARSLYQGVASALQPYLAHLRT